MKELHGAQSKTKRLENSDGVKAQSAARALRGMPAQNPREEEVWR